MRSTIVAGNWKMNCSLAEAQELMRSMLPQLEVIEGIEKVVFPPFIAMSSIACMLTGTSISLGAQNHHFEDRGAFTGEISPAMLSGLCRYVILGHSERRHIFGETSEVVNRKIKAAIRNGLTPVLCVGETLEENENRLTRQVLQEQLTASLEGLGTDQRLVVAYEPVWAIGTGKAASSEQANQEMAIIRKILESIGGEAWAQQVTLLYGGSVTGANTGDLMRQKEIDGLLVGGASLKSDDFCTISRIAAEIKSNR